MVKELTLVLRKSHLINKWQGQRPRDKVKRMKDQLKNIQRLSKNTIYMLYYIFEIDELTKDLKIKKDVLKIYSYQRIYLIYF